MKFNVTFILIFALGIFFYLNADGKTLDPCFGCDDEPILLADNDFGEHPLIHDMDETHSNRENFEPRRKGKRRSENKITPELEERINNALKDHFPEFHYKSEKLKHNHPKVYRKLLRKLRKHIRRSKEPREEKKDLISMIFEESEVDILILRYKKSDNDNEKNKLKVQIREKLSEGFDKREKIQKKVIERIEKNIAKKKKNHTDRIKNKEKLINEHLDKLLK